MISSKSVNDKIIDLWDNYYIQSNLYDWPVLYPEFKEDAILFIGINPSGDKSNKFILKSKEDLKNISLQKEHIQNEQKHMWGKEGEYYVRYFQPIRKICEAVSPVKDCISFNHIDLFFYRKQEQNDFKGKFIKRSNDSIIIQEGFAREQLNLSLEIIRNLKPKLIVVNNALASEIIQQELKVGDKDFDDIHGFHKIEINGKKVPIFFSSMMSSGRLDKGSLKRLTWHINKALK